MQVRPARAPRRPCADAASPASTTSWSWPRRNVAIERAGRLVVLDEQDRGRAVTVAVVRCAVTLRSASVGSGAAIGTSKSSARPPSSLRRAVDLPAHRLDEAADDGEADPRPAPRALALARHAVELLEQARQRLGRDARAAVLDRDPDPTLGRDRGARSGSARRARRTSRRCRACSRGPGRSGPRRRGPAAGRRRRRTVDRPSTARRRRSARRPRATRSASGERPPGSAAARRPRRDSCRGGS